MALSGLMGVTGVVASSVRPKESFLRGGVSEEDEEMEEVVVSRVKVEGHD